MSHFVSKDKFVSKIGHNSCGEIKKSHLIVKDTDVMQLKQMCEALQNLHSVQLILALSCEHKHILICLYSACAHFFDFFN